MTTEPSTRKRVGICETQPLMIEGLRAVLEPRSDLMFAGGTTALLGAGDLTAMLVPEVMVIDKTFGIEAVVDWLTATRSSTPVPSVVVWGTSLTEPEALRFLQAGARGIVRKTADVEAILSCVTAVAGGNTWMEESVFGEVPRADRSARSELTPRELQVMQLVQQGLKNKEIGRELGIRPGTVKIHLKHIFEKTGVRGRYGLALNGLKDRGIITAPPPPPVPQSYLHSF